MNNNKHSNNKHSNKHKYNNKKWNKRKSSSKSFISSSTSSYSCTTKRKRAMFFYSSFILLLVCLLMANVKITSCLHNSDGPYAVTSTTSTTTSSSSSSSSSPVQVLIHANAASDGNHGDNNDGSEDDNDGDDLGSKSDDEKIVSSSLQKNNHSGNNRNHLWSGKDGNGDGGGETTKLLNSTKLQFLHIPKTGGTAITEAAMKYNISWGYCRFQLDPNCPDLPNDEHSQRLKTNLKEVYDKLDSVGSTFKESLQYIWHYPPSIVKDIFEEVNLSDQGFNPYENADLFVVVRDPYERILSEYYYREGFFKTIDELNSVEYMNNRIQKYILIAKKDYVFMNGHTIPQYDYVYDSMNRHHTSSGRGGDMQIMKVKHVLKYENLLYDFEKLMKEYNLEVQLSSNNENQSTRKRKKRAILTKYDIYPENCDLIEDYYQNDFLEFGYSKLNKSDLISKRVIKRNTMLDVK